MTVCIPLTIGVTAGLLVCFILRSLLIHDHLDRRIRFYTMVGKAEKKAADQKVEKRRAGKPVSIISDLAKTVRTMKTGTRYRMHVQRQALRAGLLWRGEEIMVLQAAMGGLTGGIAYLLFRNGILAAVLSMAAGTVPLFWIRRLACKRTKAFEDQLGDAIALISNSIRVGHSFLQSVDAVVREMPDPMAFEFNKALKEMRLGVQTEDALHNLSERIPSRDLELLVTAILIQRQSGGNLSGILDQITATIRDRVKIKREVRTLTSQGRLSGIIVSLLPLILGAAIFFIDKAYVLLLIQNPIGNIMLGAAALSEVFGYLVIRRIVDIEL